MGAAAPIESKVYGATIGAAAGTAVSSLVLWLVGVLIFEGPHDAAHNAQAIAAVPEAVATFLRLIAAGGTAFAGGYLARHTSRPDRDPATGKFTARD
jgi:hypothetical protein